MSISLLGADPAITEIRIPMVERGYELLTARAARARVGPLRGEDDTVAEAIKYANRENACVRAWLAAPTREPGPKWGIRPSS